MTETATLAPLTDPADAPEHAQAFESGTLLEVRHLSVQFLSRKGRNSFAVDNVSFTVGAGETVGLIGESGCGKTTTALALGRLLPPQRCQVRGSVRFRRRELMALREKDIEGIRGAEIAFIFQEPGLALHPFLRVRDQVADVLCVHRHWSRRRCREQAEAILSDVNLGGSNRIHAAFPHQLSGGQRQRVVIAMAIACNPAVLVADEPTASLDASTQADILHLFRRLKDRHRIALLLITHNPRILSGLADRLLVMYAGRIVEEGAFDHVVHDPLHPYTQGLLRSLPAPPNQSSAGAKRPLPVIAGDPPDLECLPPGCSFAPRCPVRVEICTTREPEPVSNGTSRRVRCFRYGG